ncbi:hypothetical protein DMUE_2148 [Dictyocoela muelleri]|nr:hypothetical protein DMUE_2148 [Dictyocoela muelleri]
MICFWIYGASVINEANKKQCELIQSSNIYKNYRGNFVPFSLDTFCVTRNCFLFDQEINKIITINKKIESLNDLKKLKIANEIEIEILPTRYIEINKRYQRYTININVNELTEKELIQEKSWSGSFYKMTGGFSLPEKISGISNYLQALKSKLDNGYVGFLVLNDIVYLFFYNENKKRVEQIIDINGYNDKVTAFDILRHFMLINVIEEI